MITGQVNGVFPVRAVPTKLKTMNAIKEIHGENGVWSSKRVYGALLVITVIICVFIKIEHPLLEPMLYTGAGLIGLGAVEKIAQAIKGTPQQQTPIQDETNCG